MNVRINYDRSIYDGAELVFRSPVDCSQVTGLIVYYPVDDTEASKEFAFADAHGNNVGDIDHLFAENVVVKVILDVTSGMAFVQNADTNAYLEGRFDKLLPRNELSAAVNDALARAKSSVKSFGAVGNGVTDDTGAFQDALASADVVNVTKGTYLLSDTLTIRSGCKMVLDRDVHLKFIQTDKHGIVMQKFAILDGGNGTISVPEGFENGVIVFDSELDGTNKLDVFPYKNWSPMQKYGRTVRNLDIVRELPNGRHESSDGSCSGTAIYLHTSNKTNHDFLWACIIDHVNVCGAFSYGIRAKSDGGWLHDTKLESVYIDGCEVGVSLENMHHTYVDCIIQPRAAFNDTKYAKQGLKLVNSQHCMALGLKVWDWHMAATGDEYKHIAMYGNCSDFVFADMTYDNYARASDFWAATIYTDTPTNYDNITLINEPNTKWFFNEEDVPYFRKQGGVERLATYADLEANFGTSIVPNFTDHLATATDVDGTIYNGIGYKKGYRVNISSGEVLQQTDDTYTATGFIPVKSNDVIRFANFSMWINGYCGYALYDANFQRIGGMSAEALSAEHNLDYFGTIIDESGNITQFIARGSGVAYVRLSLGTRLIFANPAVSVNEEITYSTYGSLSPNITVDYASLRNVPAQPDMSVYQSKKIIDDAGYFGTDTVDGALKEVGEQLEVLSPLNDVFTTSVVPDFKDVLSKAISKDGTAYNVTGYKKGCRIDLASGEEAQDEYNTYTATGFIPVKNNDVVRFANFAMLIDGYCGFVVYDGEFNRLSGLSSQALITEYNTSYYGTVTNGSGSIVQFTLKSVQAAEYIRLSLKTIGIGENPAVSLNEEIAYSTYGSLSPSIAVDYKALINVPEATDLSIYAKKTDIPSVPVQSVNGKIGAVSLSASDVGAIPSGTKIPVKTSELTNDSGFITGYTETDPTVPSWAKASSKPTYTKSEVGLSNVDNVKQYSANNPPPYPVTSVNGKTGAVTIPIPDVSTYQTKAISDSGGYFSTDTVDGALQEIGSQLNGLAAALEALL